MVSERLYSSLSSSGENLSELRIMDLGAGNGIMGAALQRYGVSRLVGVDIISEARAAVMRDRPEVYDEYYVTDLTCDPSLPATREDEELKSWNFDCLCAVAALGFGDIPVKAFFRACNMISENGWLAFNIKESFFSSEDNSGFSVFIRELMHSDLVKIYHLERYRHRLSIEGRPLYYYSFIARKNAHVPEAFLE